MIGVRQHVVGQHYADQNAAQERHRDPGKRNAESRRSCLSDQREVGLHPGQQQQHQDAELRDRADHRLLAGVWREQELLARRPQGAQDGGSQQDAGNQLAHHRRLADPLHRFAHQASRDDQDDDLQQEDHVGRARRCLPGGHQRCREEAECDRGEQRRGATASHESHRMPKSIGD